MTQLVDGYTRIRGRHSLKAGVDIRLERLDVLQPPSPTGNFQFTSISTAGLAPTGAIASGSGHSFASFLLGQVSRFSIDAQPEVIKPRARIAEFYLQEDWRLSRRLTLN